MNYKILHGNIIDAKVDAIVLPTNSELKEGSGTSAAIYKAAGRENLAKACSKFGKIERGTAVATDAFKLDAKYIIHAVGTKWIDGNHDEYKIISSAYAYSLGLADEMDCKTIAFPLMGAGYYGFDRELAFKIAIENFERFAPKTLETIVLVIRDMNICDFIKAEGYEVGILPNKIPDISEKEEYKSRHSKSWHSKSKHSYDKNKGLDKAMKYICNPEMARIALKLAEDILRKKPPTLPPKW